jgi:hypothetical protein
MQLSGSSRQREMALAFVFFCLSPAAFATRTSLRAFHVHNHDHNHDHVDQHVGGHVEAHDHNKHAVTVVGTHVTSHFAEQMSAMDRQMVEEAMQHLKPHSLHHLEKRFMKKAEDTDAEEIVAALGDKLPTEVASLVHAAVKKSTTSKQPFSEKSLGKARNILNGMIEEAQKHMDEKMVECTQFQARNRGNLEQVVTDQARLASQLANLERLIGEANTGQKDMAAEIEKLEEKRGAAEKAYNDQLAIDTAEMTSRKNDLAVAQFILSFTVCKEKPSLFSVNTSLAAGQPSSNIGVLQCENDEGQLEFRFEDPHLEAQAQRELTPGARLKLQAWLADAHDAPAFVQSPADKNEEVVDDGAGDDDDDDDEPDKPSAKVRTTSTTTTTVKKSAAKVEVAPANPPITLVGTGRGAPDKLPAKCTLGKPNCGLLHDNMSIMWGKFKDAVDEQQDIMDANAKAWENLQADFDTQMEVFVTSDGNFAEMLSEATANKNADLEEQAKKDQEFQLLEAEYKEVWGECVAVISEILFTDICGVKTVRGEVAKFSKEVPPEKIVDCVVSEFIPTECSVPCDNKCDMHGKTPTCGGMLTLQRKVIQDKNEFGMKCPQLAYPQRCNQKKCPVNCKMGPWSGWGKCTKECEGGTQTQTRNLVVKPLNGGASCDPSTESQPCNTMSCDRDCTYPKWTRWTPCTQACTADGKHFGMTEKYRHIKIPTRGNGKCPKTKSNKRHRQKICNSHLCTGDEQCVAKMDLLIALDGSGSLRSKGYKILKKFAAAVVRRFEGEAFGNEAVKVGAIQFGNGKILKNDIISPAIGVEQLTFDIEKAAKTIEGTEWKYGFTNMAQVFAKAEEMSMNGGRKKKPSTILVLTDGKPSFVYSLAQEVDKIKAKGVKIIMVELNPTLSNPDKSIIRHLASTPTAANYLHIKGMKKLDRELDKWVQQVVVQSCPKAYSPTKFAAESEAQGYELVRENQWCGDVVTKDENVAGEGKPHHYIGTFPSPADCMAAVSALEGKYFAFGLEAGFNQGKCYMEEGAVEDPTRALDDKTCGNDGGWVSNPTDFYKILPIEVGPPEKKF